MRDPCSIGKTFLIIISASSPVRVQSRPGGMFNKLKEERAKDNPVFNCNQDSLSGSSSTTQSNKNYSVIRILLTSIIWNLHLNQRPICYALTMTVMMKSTFKQWYITIRWLSLCFMMTKNTENLHVFFPINIYGAKVIASVLLDYFFSCFLCDLLLRFFLNAINWNYENTDFVDYFASCLWHCDSETRGLHTASLASTSSFSLNLNFEA